MQSFDLLESRGLTEDIFHELKSILSSILSSVELIELYGGINGNGHHGEKTSASGKITRQAGAIKSQVIELEFQLQNIRILQQILDKTFEPKKSLTSVGFFIRNFIHDEPYDTLFGNTVDLQMNREHADAYIDEFLVRQLVLNIFFWMMKNSPTNQLPKLSFIFEEDCFEIRGCFAANGASYFFPAHALKSFGNGNGNGNGKLHFDTELLNQRIYYLISYIADLHEGSFDINLEAGKNVEILVKIPYKPSYML
ncbi:hypothetical protein [Chitinophaga japonensis]|uniref:Histidine kinase n=1 Tax=Chitinophaga japonensis TaxID=104662 RepID=A0A562T5G2_CHIJA|nr:hypothetical protein [Chitinophaga japonensis]TWI88742.1 hypothetical protein LX66_2828 [Chitinophaga japonensis]